MDKASTLKKLGLKIRDIRNVKGLSQKQLAHTVNKEQQSIQRLEAGNVNPTYFYLLEIAKGLGVDITELLP